MNEKRKVKKARRKMRRRSVKRQISIPLGILFVIIAIFNLVFISLYTLVFFYDDRFANASKLANYTVKEINTYSQRGFLVDYWVNHYSDMELIYDTASMDALEEELELMVPDLTDVNEITEAQFDSLSEDGKKLYATLCYSRLSAVFDNLKQSFDPYFLSSFIVRGDQIFYLVTGTKGEEKRISQGGEVYELGTCVPYIKGAYVVLDETLETQAPVGKLEYSSGAGADIQAFHVFEPVYDTEGNMIMIVCVSKETMDILSRAHEISKVFVRVNLLIFVVMIVITRLIVSKYVVKPLEKEQDIIFNYKNSKDSQATSNELSTIKSRNEIQWMAESFSDMVVELDRYMDEIRTVTAEKERIGAELQVAKQIQADMIPNDFPLFPDRYEFEIYASMTPAKEVGGDFYDMFIIDDDHLALVIADVSGKGVPAALFMVVSRTLIKNHAMGGNLSPAKIFEVVNDQLCEGNEAGLFVTVWMGILTISTGDMICSNAGHEYPAIRRNGGRFELYIQDHGVPLGMIEGMTHENYELKLDPGDSIYVYTDGVAEAMTLNDELFGTDRMLDALNLSDVQDGQVDVEKIDSDVRGAISEFVGEAPQNDDITMLEFLYHGPQNNS